MKQRYTVIIIFLAIAVLQCSVEKKTQYNIPQYLPEEKKAELLVNLEKGKQLYIAYCSDCHGIFKKGKDSIPNFTSKEIQNYTVAYKANSQQNHAVTKKLLPEEMSMILTFLQLRKIKSVPAHAH
mgnify:FL=1